MAFHNDKRAGFSNFEHVMVNDKFVASYDSFNDDDGDDEVAQERRREERRRRKNEKRRDNMLPDEEGDPDVLLESPKKSKRNNKKKKRARTEPWLDDEVLDIDEIFIEDDSDDELWSDTWDS
ncbi:MAG: hypothetical protein WBC91_18820 [Phototrophicaceae bacterium]